jgi:hypothetical protein
MSSARFQAPSPNRTFILRRPARRLPRAYRQRAGPQLQIAGGYRLGLAGRPVAAGSGWLFRAGWAVERAPRPSAGAPSGDTALPRPPIRVRGPRVGRPYTAGRLGLATGLRLRAKAASIR